MAMKVLEIVASDSARQAGGAGPAGLAAHTLALKRAGADVHLLLRGGAVLYGVRDQGLPDRDVVSLVQKGANVYYVEDDARARCIAADQLREGLTPVRSEDLPALLDRYKQVWRW
jgi:flavin-dependent dehydrogenase